MAANTLKLPSIIFSSQFGQLINQNRTSIDFVYSFFPLQCSEFASYEFVVDVSVLLLTLNSKNPGQHSLPMVFVPEFHITKCLKNEPGSSIKSRAAPRKVSIETESVLKHFYRLGESHFAHGTPYLVCLF